MNTPDNLKVLHIDTGRSQRGGQQQVLLLLENLHKKGVPSHLSVPENSPLIEPAKKLGIPVTPFSQRKELYPFSALKIARLAASQNISVVHAHDANAHGLARISQTIVMKAPLVVHRRVVFPINQGKLNRWKYINGVSAYITLSRAAAGTLKKIGVTEDKIAVIPSAVDIGQLEREKEAPWPVQLPEPKPEEKWLVCVGALEKEKGQKLLLSLLPKLLESHPEVVLAFLGEGPDKEDLEKMAGSMGVLEYCRFPGRIPTVAPVLSKATALVVPSLSEGFSLATVEAMALGAPVAASASGGPEEIIEAGRDGLLFSPGHLNEMHMAIERLLSDPALGKQLAEAGKQKVREKYSPESLVESTLEVYVKSWKEE